VADAPGQGGGPGGELLRRDHVVSRLSIATVWGTSPSTAPPATLPVGESGST
jgi:hypothetical protein